LARQVVGVLDGFPRWPDRPLEIVAGVAGPGGQSYLAQHGRLGLPGYDVFVPNEILPAIWERLVTSLSAQGGGPCGEAAYELTRIEAGIPRFGVDMDESHLALECGIEARAISYQKGCYIGQEVLNRIHSFGHVNRELRGLRFPAGLGPEAVPVRGARLVQGGQEVGLVTSAVFSPRFGRPLALGYVRREFLAPGTRVAAITESGELAAEVVALPFTGP
jgi:folate-binding protein YgfZ